MVWWEGAAPGDRQVRLAARNPTPLWREHMWVSRAEYNNLIDKIARQAQEITFLQAQVVLFTTLHEQERARANKATDTLLETKGMPPISTPPPSPPSTQEDLFKEDPIEVEKLLKLIDRVGVTQALEGTHNG